MTNPIKQHTVPNSYLKSFSDANEMVWVFDRKKRKIRKQPTKDTTILRNFYTLEDNVDIEDKYLIETKLFAEIIEKDFVIVLKKIVNGESLSKDDNYAIFRFVICQFGRTTKFNNEYRNIIKKKQEKGILQKHKKYLDENNIKKIDVTPHKNINIKGMMAGYNVWYDKMKEMKVTIFETSGIGDLQFITSDNPVTVIKAQRTRELRSKKELDFRVNLVNFPLSPKLSIVIHDQSLLCGNKIIIDKKTVQILNDIVFSQSDQYLISRGRKKLVNLVSKNRSEKISELMLREIEKYL